MPYPLSETSRTRSGRTRGVSSNVHLVDLTNLKPWAVDTADLEREEFKRWYSPSSFFYSQGKAIVLAATYFQNNRLTQAARGGVARKHRHRIHLALFGQLLASLEYLFKDFVAQVIDNTDIYDEKIKKAKWIPLDIAQILITRGIGNTPGRLLLHPTMGWHDPRAVNARYVEIFEYAPIASSELATLERLWILRHSVAHNAGLVITQDAGRAGMPLLSNKVVDINDEMVEETFSFLCTIARRVAKEVGDKIVLDWLRSKKESGKEYRRDKAIYSDLKWLSIYVESRNENLPKVTKGQYSADFLRANPPNA